MICVVVFADEQDKEFFDRLVDMTSESIPLIQVWKGEIFAGDESADMLIADHESFKSIRLEPRIIVFGGKNHYDISRLAGENTIVIANSCDHGQLEYISATKLPAITCGLFAKDTITLSSIERDGAVINLQRSVVCFNGETVEPQEIPVRFERPVNSYLLMAYAAIFILTGNCERLIDSLLKI